MRASLRSLAVDALSTLTRPFFRGVGCIVCLHRILPEEERSPLPCNRALELSTGGLRSVLRWVRERGLEPVPMDEVPERLRSGRGSKFIAFTLDDGYRDNAVHALPVFREFGVPFAVNVTTGFVNREAHPWWYVVERALRGRDALDLPWLKAQLSFSDTAKRSASVERVSDRLRAMTPADRAGRLAELCRDCGVDAAAITAELILNWEELRAFGADPLVAIGAHGVTHSALALLDQEEAKLELTRCCDELSERTGKRPLHLAFPFGGATAAAEREYAFAREAGFHTAVTTRSGNLSAHHAAELHALPRIGISGNYEPVRRMRRLESGVPV